MSHLGDLIQATRKAVDAKDTDQVKRYLDQIGRHSEEMDRQEQARAAAKEQDGKTSGQPASGSSGGRASAASQPSEDSPEVARKRT